MAELAILTIVATTLREKAATPARSLAMPCGSCRRQFRALCVDGAKTKILVILVPEDSQSSSVEPLLAILATSSALSVLLTALALADSSVWSHLSCIKPAARAEIGDIRYDTNGSVADVEAEEAMDLLADDAAEPASASAAHDDVRF
eukprot:CAMPEP_0197661754 /NCGR_PEP_ID=MMETSP1338-20131121/51647_1 /TAXON_ID=43686 ORGANISM="Pelagodinium beii, Strain RCC1491" /NCGR_SAMPLE_ID=MMETSP1338 /ASSEMBLY_ACC=CAM_ASM_000754 /LENGTH=146 /DNA_ID=CAMNT_0043239369 /DNA_START=420 /DNA_END=861 /DNA_ORIENTATION=-